MPGLVLDPSPLPIRVDLDELMSLVGENEIQRAEDKIERAHQPMNPVTTLSGSS